LDATQRNVRRKARARRYLLAANVSDENVRVARITAIRRYCDGETFGERGGISARRRSVPWSRFVVSVGTKPRTFVDESSPIFPEIRPKSSPVVDTAGFRRARAPEQIADGPATHAK